jgi:hypothetical protein
MVTYASPEFDSLEQLELAQMVSNKIIFDYEWQGYIDEKDGL